MCCASGSGIFAMRADTALRADELGVGLVRADDAEMARSPRSLRKSSVPFALPVDP
jgi:hypothetical protein